MAPVVGSSAPPTPTFDPTRALVPQTCPHFPLGHTLDYRLVSLANRRHFLHFGDDRMLTQFYENGAAYVKYLNTSTQKRLVDWGLADWNSPLPECSG